MNVIGFPGPSRGTAPAAESHPRHHNAVLPRLSLETDFRLLRGRRVLCVVDEDNLRISISAAHGRDLRLSYRELGLRLEASATRAERIAVLTDEPGGVARANYLERRGWTEVTITRETVMTCHGPRVKGNADFDLAMECGLRLYSSDFDALLIGTGDGDLAVSLARGARRHRPDLRGATLAIPGCTSWRLTHRPDLFNGHIAVGLDLVRGQGSRQQAHYRRT